MVEKKTELLILSWRKNSFLERLLIFGTKKNIILLINFLLPKVQHSLIFLIKKKYVFFVCFMMFRSLVDENLSKNCSSTTQNGNCENFIEFYLKEKKNLIDDEPTKKHVYLTFYRKFPKKKQKKNGLFWYSKKKQHINTTSQ